MLIKKLTNIGKSPLFILSLLFFLIRLPFLDQVFLLHDERDIVLSGYSIAKTGRDLFGNFLPLRFENISPSNPLIAIYYSALWHLIFPKSVFFGRLAYIFSSVFLLYLIYKIVFFITKNKNKALFTSAIFCFSPWIFHITRMALEISLALSLIFLGIFFYLKKKYFFSFFLFLISAFTYQGFKILIPFLLFYLEFFFFITKEKGLYKRLLYILIFIILVGVSSFLIDKNIALKRSSELIFSDMTRLKKIVDFRRDSSLANLDTSKFFDNKLTVLIDHFIDSCFKNYDVTYLFKSGDANAINGNISAGQFFQIFILFYFFGLCYLGKNKKKEDWFLFGFSLIGIIPSIIKIEGTSFSIRGSVSALGFSYLLALGLIFYWDLIKNIKNKYSQSIINVIILLIFFINIISFFYNYFYRRPILIAELFNQNEKQLALYLISNEAKLKEKIKIYHRSPKDIYLSLFLLDKNADLKFFQQNLKKGLPYQWKNYYFQLCKNDYQYLKEKGSIVYEGCLTPQDYQQYEEKITKKIKYKDYYSGRTAYFIID